ncbi:MAG: hypothetical protein JWN53_1000 [Gemmatimonadetes bacterium]|nr:hypothetical protein [Gemmatimonadota bacterium]
MIDNTTADARDATRASSAREGFALPMAILVIAFLTMTIAAAYAATSSELTTNTAQRGESRAFQLAQAGLENFMARRNEVGFCASCGAPPTTTYESTTVILPGGYAQVVAQQIRVASNTQPAIYLLRSRGVDTISVVTASSIGSYAERTVAQLVYWNVNQVNVLSGWTATNGLDKNGSSGTISGVDACNAAQGGGKPTVAGIAVPTGDYTVSGNFTPEGSPPIQYLGTQAQTNAAVKIDWNGIINGNRIQPDFTFPTSGAATAGWPTFSASYYPVIRVNDDFTLPTTGGQGTLIVMGNLTMSGNNLWHGILLVGGQMTSNGNGTVNGATESGLNTLLTAPQLAAAQTMSPATLLADPPSAVANGTKTFQYNSCDVAKAAGGLASYSVYPNAWMDNLVTY